MPMKVEAQRKLRAEARAKGNCIRCFGRPATEGYVTCEPCRVSSKEYYQRNKSAAKKAAKEHYQTHRSERHEQMRQYDQKRRAKAIALLGGRCRGFDSYECRWENPDKTFGCDDVRILQIDHKNGNGVNELRRGRSTYIGSDGVVAKVINGNVTDYQVLCPNCNWLKRVIMRELNQHTKYLPVSK